MRARFDTLCVTSFANMDFFNDDCAYDVDDHKNAMMGRAIDHILIMLHKVSIYMNPNLVYHMHACNTLIQETFS